MATRILVADDEALIRGSLREILEYEGHEVEEAVDGLMAWEMLQKSGYDAVFCDIKMPGMDGVELLEKTMAQHPVAFIMISGHGDIDTAVDCIKKGAFDFIAKPLELNRILVSLKNALERGKMADRTRHLQRQVESKYRIVGGRGAFAEALEMADKVAPTDARELFGHEKGSFTSALRQRKGSFEQAQDGTIFLDEIGDMSLSAQAKVLRALQENVIMRVGGEKPIEVNTRVIAATNKDLEKEIAEGRFREDLYHRLSVIVIRVPDLKDHKEDIPELVAYFNEQVSSGMGKPPREITSEAMALLCSQPWPGNIRQLRNIVERLLILCPGIIGKEEVERYL